MKEYGYTVHLVPEPEGGYTVTVPAIPEVVTWGEDWDKALEMAREAIEGALQVFYKEEGRPIPEESKMPREAHVKVSIATQ